MTNEEELLINLENGKYDGFRVDYPSYGSVKRGGRVDKGVYIMNGQLVEFTDRTTKFFDGKENEKSTTREKYILETDDEKLALLQKVGYKMYDHTEVRDFSKSFYTERDRMIKSAQETSSLFGIESETEVFETMSDTATNDDISDIIDNYSVEIDYSDDQTESDSDNGKTVLIIVAAAAAVAVGTWVTIKAVPKIKRWWDQKIIPKFNKSKEIEQISDMQCPACGGLMNKDECGTWKCNRCDYSISDIELNSTVFWFCDGCGKFMNIQRGFSTYKPEWTCLECGCKNLLTADNILDE